MHYMQSSMTKCLSFLIQKMFSFHYFFFKVEWTIVNPPINWKESNIVLCYCQTKHQFQHTQLHGQVANTIQLLDSLVVQLITENKQKFGKWDIRKFESILQIYKFDGKDVNVDYSCSIGGSENIKRLSLALDKFECQYDII